MGFPITIAKGHVGGHDGACADHRVLGRSYAGQDRAIRAERCPLLDDGSAERGPDRHDCAGTCRWRRLRWARRTRRPRASRRRRADAALDGDPVAEHDVVLDEAAVADVAVAADAGAGENVDERPDAGAVPIVRCLAQRSWMRRSSRSFGFPVETIRPCDMGRVQGSPLVFSNVRQM